MRQLYLIVVWLLVAAPLQELAAARRLPVPFSWNRGVPDGGRAVNSGLGAIQINPAAMVQTPRYIIGSDGTSMMPTQDFTLSTGVSDSQSSELGGEFNYDLCRSLNGPLQQGITHRLTAAIGERYTEKIYMGILGRMELPDVGGLDSGPVWGYGLGVIIPVLPEFRIGISSGDWFAKGDSTYQYGNGGIGFGVQPIEWLTLSLDGTYRWGEEIGNGISLTFGTILLFSDLAALRLGYNWAPEFTGHTGAAALELQFFPVTVGVDGRYESEHGAVIGLSIQTALFYD